MINLRGDTKKFSSDMKKLNELRKKIGLNHREMSELMGVSLSSYNHWRHGHNNMSQSAIRNIGFIEIFYNDHKIVKVIKKYVNGVD